MTRRNFLKKSIVGGALLPLATPAIAQSAKRLRLLSSDATAAAALSSRISAVTDGALIVETTEVSMSDASDMLSRVTAGEADMCLTSLDHFASQSTAFGLFGSMPFGMCAAELEGWVHASDGGDMLAMLGEAHNVSIRFAGNTGTKPMWSKQPLSDLAGFQGQAIASTGLGIANLKQTNVSNVSDLNSPSTDLADQDVLDGVSVTEMQQKGLLQTFPNITLCNPNSPNGILALAISNDAMAGMSEAEKIVIERASSAALVDGLASAFHNDATALTAAGSALTVQAMPDDIWNALRDSSQNLLTEIFESGDIEATVVDAYVYFLTDVAGWSEIGEAAFYAGRKRLASM